MDRSATSSQLLVSPALTLRPMADGSIMLVGGSQPMVADGLTERVLVTCSRRTDRDELVDLLAEATDLDRDAIDERIDQLLELGALEDVRPSGPGGR